MSENQEKKVSETVSELLCDIADGVATLYGKGYKEGCEDGAAQGFENGKKAEYDAFWDVYQNKGKRTAYRYAFAGSEGWNDETFDPKYTIKAEGLSGVSLYYTFNQANISDIKAILDAKGLTIDTSGAQGLYSTFEGCQTKNIPTIDAKVCNQFYRTFYDAKKLVKIEILNIKEGCTFSNAFYNCSALETLTVSGTIGSVMDLHFSTKLTHDSLMNVIGCLKDFIAAGQGITKTLTLGSTNLAKLTDAEKAVATAKGWSLA